MKNIEWLRLILGNVREAIPPSKTLWQSATIGVYVLITALMVALFFSYMQDFASQQLSAYLTLIAQLFFFCVPALLLIRIVSSLSVSYRKVSFVFLIFTLALPLNAYAIVVFETRVLLSVCDAEEEVNNGSMSLSSSDLELTFEGSSEQVIGTCFQNISIPQGAQISNAYIQFTVDETKNTDGTLSIHGQAADSAGVFTGTAFDISSRSKTVASVNWNPPQWTSVGESGVGQRTPDLTSIVQEIVNRSGWQSDNHMAFIFGGSGVRVAEAYNGTQASAPLLHIEYDTGGGGDTEAPSQPQNLSASTVSTSQINLSWDASTDNVAVSDYNITRDGSLLTNVAGTSYSDTGLMPGTTYSYMVSALDAAGNESAQSTSASATTSTGGTETLTIIPTDDATITDAAPNTNYGNSTSVEVDASGSNGVEDFLMKFNVSGINGRAVTSATLRLFNENSSSIGGAFHQALSAGWDEGSVTWNTAPPVGALIDSLGAVTTDTWYDVDLTTYITSDGTYSIRVSSSSSNGAGYSSTEAASNQPQLVIEVSGASGGDTEAPSQPQNLSASAVSTSQINLSWDASADNVGVSGYNITRDGSLLTNVAGTSYSDTGLMPGTTYSYMVSALDAAGNESAQSTSASATTSTGGTETLTIIPTDDATIREAAPNTNYGDSSSVEVDANESNGAEDFLMKFNVSGINGRAVTSATLRLFNDNPSSIGGAFHQAFSTGWDEGSVTWNTAPPVGALIDSLGAVATDTWYDVDLTAYITSDGTYSIRVSSSASNGAGYSSTEAASNQPQLVIEVSGGDTTAPSVTLTSPADGVTVSGTITLTASASDNVGIAYVDFRWDSESFGPADVTEPYSFAWDTTTFTDGFYTLTALAEDTSGNQTISNLATVQVSNIVSPPTVTLTASPTTIVAGASSLLEWSSTNADACVGTSFSTENAVSGVVTVSPSVDTTYSVDCTGSGGAASDSVVVTVNTSGSVTASLSANPGTISAGGSSTLSWSSTQADTCTGTNFSTDGATSGSVFVTPLSNTTYTVGCTGAEGAASDSVTVFVTEALRVPQDFPTIQEAIDAAQDGETVLIAPGTYVITNTLSIASKSITLTSLYHTTGDENFIAQTVIDGGNTAPILSISSPAGGTTIKGLTFFEGNKAIQSFSDNNILNNRFIDNDSDSMSNENSGGVIRGNYFQNSGDDAIDSDGPSNLLIEDNDVVNASDDGIEIRNFNYNGPLIMVIIRNNSLKGSGEDGIQLIDYSANSDRVFHFEGNLIADSVDAGLGLMDNGETTEDCRAADVPERVYVFNNTFDGNNWGICGGDNLVAVNNIITNSLSLGMKNVDGNSIVSHTLFYGNVLDETGSNLDIATAVFDDPMFTSEHHLNQGSAAIDAGTAQFVFDEEIVLDIPASEYSGSAPDLGWQEYSGGAVE